MAAKLWTTKAQRSACATGEQMSDILCGKCGKWVSRHPDGVGCIPDTPKPTISAPKAKSKAAKAKAKLWARSRKNLTKLPADPTQQPSTSVKAASAGLPGHGKRR